MPNNSSDRRERKAARTRTEILEAARRLFADKGFAATTVADVAAEADVAVQTIYAHVGSKGDLVLALVDAHGRRIRRSGSRYRHLVGTHARGRRRSGSRVTPAPGGWGDVVEPCTRLHRPMDQRRVP